jgi:hypothetical protein
MRGELLDARKRLRAFEDEVGAGACLPVVYPVHAHELNPVEHRA